MLKKLFSRFQKSEGEQLYADMRNQMLTLDASHVGIKKSEAVPNVWGVLTEFGIGKGIATVVSLVNGTTNIFFSSGAGFLGSGDYTLVSQATRELVSSAERYISLMEPVRGVKYPSPSNGYIRFYFLTFSGVFTTEVPETIPMDERTHPMYDLYAHSHNVIRQVRIITQSG
jgi:hypothetical protein